MPRGQEPNAKQVVADLRSIFRGVVKQYDPGALLAGELQDAQNARLVNGNLISRGGQSKVNGTAPVSGAPLAIFDDWTGDAPSYPIYGSFQGYTIWAASDVEPPYYQVHIDFTGGSVVQTLFPRDASLLGSYFFLSPPQPVYVGGYWYTIGVQIIGASYGGTPYSRNWYVARAAPGAGWELFDLYTMARQGVVNEAVNWSGFTIAHDGDNFLVSIRANDSVANTPPLYNSTYQSHILRLTTDGSTTPVRVGDLLADINPTITGAGGTAIVLGGNSPQFGIFCYGGYYLAYPMNNPATYLDDVGSTKPGYAAYMEKNGSTWALINSTASPVASGAPGRTRWLEVHDGKVYLLTATDHDLLGDCICRVWDPATDPAVITPVFTLTGGRRWLTSNSGQVNGGNAVSYRGKLYFSWTTGSSIGVGSWDGSTLEEDVFSVAFAVSAASPVWLMPMRTGLALITLDGSFSPDRLRVWYSNGTDLTSWSTTTLSGVQDDIRAFVPEVL